MPSYRKSRYTGAAGTAPTTMQSVRRVEYLIPRTKTGAVMGKGGENIRRITETSGANITYDRNSATPTHAVFVLQGQWNDVIKASDLISEAAGVKGTMKGVDPTSQPQSRSSVVRGSYDGGRDTSGDRAGSYGRNAPRSSLSGPSAAQPSQGYRGMTEQVYSDYMTRLQNDGANPYRGGPSREDDDRLLNMATAGSLGGPGARSTDYMRKDIERLENLLDHYGDRPYSGRQDRGGQYAAAVPARDVGTYGVRGSDAAQSYGQEGRDGQKRRNENWDRTPVPEKRMRVGMESAWNAGASKMDSRMEEQRRMEEVRRIEEQRHMEERRRMEEQRRLEEQRRMEEQKRAQQRPFEEERRRREEQRRMQELREERQRMEQRRRMEMELMEQRKKLEEQKQMEQQRLMEQQRMFEQQRLEEERQLAAERRRLEQEKFMEEQRLIEERRRTEMAQARLMEERRIVEQQFANLARMQENINFRQPMMDREMMPPEPPMNLPMNRPPMDGPFGPGMMGHPPMMNRGPMSPPGLSMRGRPLPSRGRGRPLPNGHPGRPGQGPLGKRLTPSEVKVLSGKVQQLKSYLVKFQPRGNDVQALRTGHARSKCNIPLNFALNEIKKGSKTELEGILCLGEIMLAQVVGTKERAIKQAAYKRAMHNLKMMSPRAIIMSPNPPVIRLSPKEEEEMMSKFANSAKPAADTKDAKSEGAAPQDAKPAADDKNSSSGTKASSVEVTPEKTSDELQGKEKTSSNDQKVDSKEVPNSKPAEQKAVQENSKPGQKAPQQAKSSTPAKPSTEKPAQPSGVQKTTPVKGKEVMEVEHACDEFLGIGDKLEPFRQELMSLTPKSDQEMINAFNKLAQEQEISIALIFLRDPVDGAKVQGLTCEVFLEDLFVVAALGADKKSSKTAAYKAALATLKPDDAISQLVVQGRRLKYNDIRRDSLIDYVYSNNNPESEGQDTETNVSHLKRMGLYPVNPSRSVDCFVYVESENPRQPVNLKTMAAINGMLFRLELSTNLSRPAGKRHKCDVFVQNKLIATAFMSSKKAAKQAACENALKALNTGKHNVIKYLPLQDMKSLQTEASITALATQLWKAEAGSKKAEATLTPKTEGYEKWITAALNQLVDTYMKQVTLDLLPFSPELPAAIHVIMTSVAQHHGFVYVQTPGSKYFYVQKNRQRRSAGEICCLLQVIPGGRSGRYKLVRETTSLAPADREKIKEQYFANKEIIV